MTFLETLRIFKSGATKIVRKFPGFSFTITILHNIQYIINIYHYIISYSRILFMIYASGLPMFDTYIMGRNALLTNLRNLVTIVLYAAMLTLVK